MILEQLVKHLPVLPVIVPLISAPVCLLLRNGRLAWWYSMLVAWLVLGISIRLMVELSLNPDAAISYPLGGWQAPYGIEYRLDWLGGLVLVIVSSIAAVVLPTAGRLLEGEVPESRRHLFFAAFLLCLTGLLGIASTGDLFNVFVFLEIASLSSYALIAMGRGRRALTAAFGYLVMGTIGSTFIVIGIGLAYMMTGTLNIADLAERLTMTLGEVFGEGAALANADQPVNQTATTLAAFAFLTVGISLKMALFPLHAWLPNAYAHAPSMVSAFLAATSTKVSYYLFLRVIFTIFGATLVFGRMQVQAVLMPLALAAVFVGSAVAIYQVNLKRLLAWSSVAQIGYLVLAASFGTRAGLTAGIVHLFNHALTKGGLFLVVGAIGFRLHSVSLDDMKGIGRRMPWTMAAFVVGGLNLIGIPLTSGFVSKWYLVAAAIENGSWGIAVLVLLGSLLAAVYVWRVIEVAWFAVPDDPTSAELREAPAAILVPAWVLLGATLVFGVYTELPVGVAVRAAEFLLP